jgi:putative phage-type endonuclease
MLSQEQLEMRLTGVTGSEIAAVAGLSPYAGPLDIWLLKKQLAESIEDNYHTERGNFFEPAMLSWYAYRWYAYRTKQTLRYPGTLRHPKHNVVIATPDAATDRCGVEAKAPSRRTWHQWGEPGTDDVPEHYALQATFEAAVLGLPSVDVVTVLDDDLAVFPVRFDEELFAALLGIAERFWHDHVLADVPPPPDASKRARAWLLKEHPKSTLPLIDASEKMIELAREYDKARAAETEAEKRREALGNQLRMLLEDHAGARADGVSISYKNNKDSVVVDWQSIVSNAQIPEHIIASHTYTKPGPRVLRVTVKGEK